MKRTFAMVVLLAVPAACSSGSSGGGSPGGSSSGGESSSGGASSSGGGGGSSSGANSSSGASSGGGNSSGSGTGSSGGGTAGGATAACIAGLTPSTACATCETSGGGCQALVTGQIKSGCSDYLACVCPNGAAAPASQSVVTSCAAMAQESSCQTATGNLTACGQSNCSSSCATAAMAYACTLLQACCEGLGCYDAGCEMQGCLTVVQNNPNDEQLCASDLSAFHCTNIPDGGLDAGM